MPALDAMGAGGWELPEIHRYAIIAVAASAPVAAATKEAGTRDLIAVGGRHPNPQPSSPRKGPPGGAAASFAATIDARCFSR
jgi:hypothetical protein